MKRFFAVLLAAAMLLSFASCGEKKNDSGINEVFTEIPEVVEAQVKKDMPFYYGYEVKNLKLETVFSVDGATMYYISGQLDGEAADGEKYEKYKEYKDGYFSLAAIHYTDYGDVSCFTIDLYKKDDKDNFKNTVSENVKECKDRPDYVKDELEGVVEMKEAAESGAWS